MFHVTNRRFDRSRCNLQEEIQSIKLTVRPWKYPFPKGKDRIPYSNHPFSGAFEKKFPPSNGWCAKILFGVASRCFHLHPNIPSIWHPFLEGPGLELFFSLKKTKVPILQRRSSSWPPRLFPRSWNPRTMDTTRPKDSRRCGTGWSWDLEWQRGSHSSLQQGVNVVCQLYLLNKKHRGVTTKRPQDVCIYIYIEVCAYI